MCSLKFLAALILLTGVSLVDAQRRARSEIEIHRPNGSWRRRRRCICPAGNTNTTIIKYERRSNNRTTIKMSCQALMSKSEFSNGTYYKTVVNCLCPHGNGRVTTRNINGSSQFHCRPYCNASDVSYIEQRLNNGRRITTRPCACPDEQDTLLLLSDKRRTNYGRTYNYGCNGLMRNCNESDVSKQSFRNGTYSENVVNCLCPPSGYVETVKSNNSVTTEYHCLVLRNCIGSESSTINVYFRNATTKSTTELCKCPSSLAIPWITWYESLANHETNLTFGCLGIMPRCSGSDVQSKYKIVNTVTNYTKYQVHCVCATGYTDVKRTINSTFTEYHCEDRNAYLPSQAHCFDYDTQSVTYFGTCGEGYYCRAVSENTNNAGTGTLIKGRCLNDSQIASANQTCMNVNGHVTFQEIYCKAFWGLNLYPIASFWDS